MSLSFYLPHKKTLFFGKILKVGDILPMIPKLQIFPDTQKSKEDLDKFHESKLNEHTSLMLGIARKSARGFEVSFEKDPDGKDAYRVRFLTPSTVDDWKIGLSFIKELATKLKVKIISEYGESYTAETIESYPYEKDILFGISSYFAPSVDSQTGKPLESNISTYTIPGLYRTAIINRETQKKWLDSPSPVDEFSKFYTKVQKETAYPAVQKFYRMKADNSLIGVYQLLESVDTVLPFEPFVEFENMHIAKNKDVKEWKLRLVCHEGDPDDFDAYSELEIVDYREFMKHLPKDCYEFIDAAYIVVFEMTKQQILDILEKMK
ncbi:MAG: DUF4299 family protein [Bacillota bacterium]|nr:DUF4299 family protein [Bacillota bacterium]